MPPKKPSGGKGPKGKDRKSAREGAAKRKAKRKARVAESESSGGEGPVPTRADLAKLKVAELRAACTSAKLNPAGVRDQLLQRLLEHHGLVSRSPSPELSNIPTDSSGCMKLTPQLLFDLGHIDNAMREIVESCDSPKDGADVLVAVAVFMWGKGTFDARTPSGPQVTPGRLARLPLPSVPGEGGQPLGVDGGILGNYAGANAGRRAVFDMFYQGRVNAVVQGPGLPKVANFALFAGAFEDVLDRSLAAAIPAALIPSVLAGSPARKVEQASGQATGEEREKEKDKNHQARYMMEIKKANQDKYIPEDNVATARIHKMMGLGLDLPDGQYFISQDPGAQLAAMKPLINPRTGSKTIEAPYGNGVMFTTSSGGSQKAELTDAAIAKMHEEFEKEAIDASYAKAKIMATTTYVLCHKNPGRLARTTLEMYEVAIERLFKAPGMTGEKFRRILLQGEQVRMKVTNDADGGAGAGDVDTSIDAGYRKAINRINDCMMNHTVDSSGPGNRGPSGAGGRSSAGSGGASSNAGRGDKGKKRQRVRKEWPKLPGGMGSVHNGGQACTNPRHDPAQGGDKNALCGRSHVHWDAALNPTADQVALAISIADAANK